jgi:hypothetical protein
MEQFTQELGATECVVEKELKFGKTDLTTKVTGVTTRRMVKDV